MSWMIRPRLGAASSRQQVEFERQPRQRRTQFVGNGVGHAALVLDQRRDPRGHLVEGFADVANAGDAREPHAYAQVALAHAQRGVAQRVHVAPDRQRPQQQQRGRQQQAQHDPGAPGQRLVHRVIARQLHFQPLPGLAGQRHDDGLEVVAHQETGGVDLAEFVLGGLDLGVRQQPQLQAVMGQDLLQQKGGAVGGATGSRSLCSAYTWPRMVRTARSSTMGSTR